MTDDAMWCDKCKKYHTPQYSFCLNNVVIEGPAELAEVHVNLASDNQSVEAGGVKFDGEKPRFDLIPPEAMFALADLYAYGAKKYADRNWERGMRWGRCFAALLRHLWRWWAGEKYDKEDGQHHLVSVIWEAIALYTFEVRGMSTFDDRLKTGIPPVRSGGEWMAVPEPEDMAVPDEPNCPPAAQKDFDEKVSGSGG